MLMVENEKNKKANFGFGHAETPAENSERRSDWFQNCNSRCTVARFTNPRIVNDHNVLPVLRVRACSVPRVECFVNSVSLCTCVFAFSRASSRTEHTPCWLPSGATGEKQKPPDIRTKEKRILN
uniref:Uncharacterized protein n=1 Tax=Anopheles atroparvus TaxID=41427 RepID=A0AAG5DD71_ANOAO